jgi:hypothetical protein
MQREVRGDELLTANTEWPETNQFGSLLCYRLLTKAREAMSRLTACAVLGAALLSIVECPIARAEPPQDEESLGQKLDRRLDKLGRELRHGWAEVRASIDRMGVQGRVYGRLHWDKDLANATIDIEVREDKSVVLKGSVPTESAKSKAVQLAQDTTGVHEVVDELGIAGK